jgi:Tol biopolymer transport system component
MTSRPLASASNRSIRLVWIIGLLVTSLLGPLPASALVTFGLDVVLAGDGSGSVVSEPAGINCSEIAFECSADFDEGTVVTLTATPAPNAVFAGWSGACTGAGSCVVTMNSAAAVTATFDTANVTVTKAGDGSGTVTSSPAGIDCGGDCTEPYLPGTTVTLTAAPTAKAVFTGWSGACTGTAPCVITASTDTSVTATFDTARLFVAKAGDGGGTVSSSPAGINCGTDCNESYLPGTAVTLTAAPAANAVFIGWSGACTGTGSCVLPMTTDASVTATFDTATLSVTRAGLGAGLVTSSPSGINCGLDCSESYLPGTSVTLTAAASAGGTFSGWSGACSGTGPCVLNMSTDASVVATFQPAGVNGKIVYDCALDICVVNEDGTGLVNLTNSPDVYDIHPVWSPDGTRIAFASSRTSVATNTDGNIEIFVMNADGSNVVQQTFTTTGLGQFINSYEPSWNPAGTQIVFEGWRANGFPQIIKINVDGIGTETVLTTASDSASRFSPDWSPDGTKILFTWSLGQQDIHVINADGSQETSLTPDLMDSDQRGAVWSPDGARFAFTDTRFWNIPTFNTEIFVRNADGSGEVQVTDHPSIDEEASWSPDGTEIAFSSARGGSYDIWSIAVPPAGAAFQLMAEPAATQITSGSNDDTSPNWFGSGTTPTTFTLSVAKAGSGGGTVTSSPVGINCGSDCSEAYASGTSVTLTAAAAAGSTFAGWSGACTGSGSCVVSMTQARSVTATFNTSGGGPFTLTVAKAGTGSGSVTSSPAGINCGGDCTESYVSGASVTLTARAARGSTFAGWSGACTGSGSCVVSMTQARSVTATFNTSAATTSIN